MNRDHEMINKGMLMKWNEEWNDRGSSEAAPVVLEDDEYAELASDEDVVG